MFSEDNLSLLAKSFKDEKFRKLFTEYAKDLCDPEKQKQYERELKQYEKERGVDIVFIEPRPFLALAAVGGGGERVFVNICLSDAVQKPSFEIVNDDVQKGQKWSFPHVIPQPRREHLSNEVLLGDGEGGPATVHDVVFHPDAMLLASRNNLIRQTVIKTAVDSVNKNSKATLTNPKQIEGMNYIGQPVKSVLKKVVDQTLYDKSENCDIFGQKKEERTSSNKKNKEKNKNAKENGTKNGKGKPLEPVMPVHKIKHVSKLDMQDFSVQLIPDWKNGRTNRPEALEVEVLLPGITRAVQVDAQVLKQKLHLATDSTPQYKLELPLPYPVDDDSSSAKFDVSTQKLILTFPVIPSGKKDQLSPHSPPCDSGIECEIGYRTNSDGDNSSEVSVSSQEDASREEDSYDSVFGTNSPPRKPMIIPSYGVKQNAESLIIILNCGNVLPSSIETRRTDQHTARIELASIGGGQTLLHYGLSVLCNPHTIPDSGIRYELTEDSVLLTIMKDEPNSWKNCQIGSGDSFTLVELEPVPSSAARAKSAKDKSKEGVRDEMTQRAGSEDGQARADGIPPRSPRICRTLSMCETSAPSRTVKSATCSWPRGILKHRTRSLSESQVGALTPQTSLASSLDLDLPEDLLLEGEEEEEEEEEGSMASSLGEKKSVRFNEVVSRQLFRTNRSILMERAKAEKMKQRRRRNKGRRPSESDRTSESCSDRENDESGRRRRRDTGGSSEEQTSATATTTTDDETTTDTCDVDDLENNNYTKNTKNSNNSKKEKKNKSEGGDAEKSKKKRKKNKKNKKFEPSNNFIFQLDIEA